MPRKLQQMLDICVDLLPGPTALQLRLARSSTLAVANEIWARLRAVGRGDDLASETYVVSVIGSYDIIKTTIMIMIKNYSNNDDDKHILE